MRRSDSAGLAVRGRVGLRLRERVAGRGRCIEDGDDDLRGHAVALVPLAQLCQQLLTVSTFARRSLTAFSEHVMGQNFDLDLI